MKDQPPLYLAPHDAAEGGRSFWLTASDGARLRMALWPKGDRGLVLLFPGRTEYIEKYGRATQELARRGYGVAVIDWRGQGLSDRPKSDRMVGHVENFLQYQQDVAALLAKLEELGHPGPHYLICHSMGGCIGLRSLLRGLDVRAVAFSAPMWGIKMAAGLKPAAHLISKAARLANQGQRYAPGTGAQTYVATAEFEGNVLTRDAETYAWMQAQASAHPDLSLGGPGMQWLDEAISECNALEKLPSPAIPAYCALGDKEQVVAAQPVKNRMTRWPGGTLDIMADAEHEIMMEVPATRTRFFDRATQLFEANS